MDRLRCPCGYVATSLTDLSDHYLDLRAHLDAMQPTLTAEVTYQLGPYETGRLIGWYLGIEWPVSISGYLLAMPVPEDASPYDFGFVDGLQVAWEANEGYRERLGNGYGI